MQITQQNLIAYATCTSHLDPVKIKGGDVSDLKFSTNEGMTAYGWTIVGRADITLHLDDDNKLIASAVDALRAEAANIRAEATAKCTAIDRKVNELLAIEMSAPAAEAFVEVRDEADA